MKAQGITFSKIRPKVIEDEKLVIGNNLGVGGFFFSLLTPTPMPFFLMKSIQ
jgi:hypothetical protein